MAITQNDIIDEIPAYINAESFDHLLSLQALTSVGWGTQTKLYSYLGELVGISIYAENKQYKFDREKLSCSLITNVSKASAKAA